MRKLRLGLLGNKLAMGSVSSQAWTETQRPFTAKPGPGSYTRTMGSLQTLWPPESHEPLSLHPSYHTRGTRGSWRAGCLLLPQTHQEGRCFLNVC